MTAGQRLWFRFMTDRRQAHSTMRRINGPRVGVSAGAGRLTAMTEPLHEEGQFALLPELERARREALEATLRTAEKERTPAVEAAATLPVARVLVDVPLAHLDRPFDYLVPAAMHDKVVPGSRVKIRFAGQDVDGYVVERVDASDHPGR